MTAADAYGPYAGWMGDDEVIRFLEVRFRPRDADALAAYITRMNDSADNLFLGLFLKSDGRHVGNIKLGPIHPIHKRADIGTVIGERSQWGHGLAAEAIAAVTRHAFERLGLHRVAAGCYASNVGSLSAYRKAGFSLEGTLVGHWLTDGGWEDEILLGRVNPKGRERTGDR